MCCDCLLLQRLEVALSDARQTISQLRAAAANGEADSQATVSSLLSELAEKSSQLVDAEHRFSELEAMMQRIASRTGQGQGQQLGMNALRSSFGEFGFEQQHRPHSPQQKQSLRSSWGGQYGLDGVCEGPNNCLPC
jgi:hypothetical protein